MVHVLAAACCGSEEAPPRSTKQRREQVLPKDASGWYSRAQTVGDAMRHG